MQLKFGETAYSIGVWCQNVAAKLSTQTITCQIKIAKY